MSDNSYATSVTTVAQGPLASQLNASGTLEYTTSEGSGYNIINQASGTFTELPAAGETVSRGQVLYRVSNDPVILFYGDTPVYRSLFEGDTGPDVRELNANLVALGYATRSELDPSSDYFSSETAYALELLQYKLGEDESGSLTEGQAVFLPGQARIASVSATLGTNAGPGAPIMQATSARRQVVVDLDASEQTEVNVGDQAQVTLPDGDNTPGVVSGIGTVATSGSSGAILPLYITLDHAKAAGTLDQAPVTVEITTAAVKDALIVPVDALLALSGGGYAVETINDQGVHQLVAVTLGTFDDADGTVQVTGDLQPGERIVVPNL
ncbi:MAG: efflux RND transporter periplasmic adaptor subunit [Solirubrobacteraceae bacterium]